MKDEALLANNIETGEDIFIDFDKVIEEKVLIQATNGGGKSYLVRKIAEEASKKNIPQVIIQKDPEFNSLRDKFDYVIVGDKREDGADIQISMKIPEYLAKKIVELPTISFILDLSALIVSNRKEFLRRFLDEINSTKRKFWHDRIFIIDEAHIFAPEKGKGQSEALRSIEELASQGRKKGFSLICCTQRLSKLSKDVTGELSIKFIGKTIDPEDRKRNAEELGMSTKPNDLLVFKKLGRPNFHFYAVGSGISDEPILIKTRECETKHEIQRGNKKQINPPSSEKLKTILSSIENLPEEAEKEKESIENLKKKVEDDRKIIFDLEQKIKINERKQFAINPINTAKMNQAIENVKLLQSQLSTVIQENHILVENGNKLKEKMEIYAENHSHLLSFLNSIEFKHTRVTEIKIPVTETQQTTIPFEREIKSEMVMSDETIKLKKGERDILEEVARAFPNSLSRSQARVLCGIKKDSTMYAYQGRLKTAGFIDGTDPMILTELGKSQFQTLPQKATSHEEIMGKWLPAFKQGERKILNYLVSIHPSRASFTQIQEVCDINKDSTMYAYLGRLQTPNLIIKTGNEYEASKELFP
jgi:hypothetical protein